MRHEDQSKNRPDGEFRQCEGDCLRLSGRDVCGQEPENHGRKERIVRLYASGNLFREGRAEEVQQSVFRSDQLREAGAAGDGSAGVPAAD